MDRALRLGWSVGQVRSPWVLRGIIAAAAALPVLGLMVATPAPWWAQSGFDTFPGTFVRTATDNYPLCRPWRDPVPGMHKDPSTHVTTRFGAISGSDESNFAVLLPSTAKVTGIYCGAAPRSSPLSACTVMGCAGAAHIQVEDSLFTRGRGVELSIRSKTAKPGQRTDVGFWVLWKEGGHAAPRIPSGL